MLMTHYREPIDFSVKRLVEAENLIVKLERRAKEGDAGSLDSFFSALKDELNTTQAIGHLNPLSGKPLQGALELLGVVFSEMEIEVSTDDIQVKIDERLAFFAAKNFDEADRIRADLLEQGIQLNDSKDSETGERITTWEVKR